MFNRLPKPGLIAHFRHFLSCLPALGQLGVFILLTFFAGQVVAAHKKSCEDALLKNRYADLNNAEISVQLRQDAQEIRDQVNKKLHGLPVVQVLDLTAFPPLLSDIRLFESGAVTVKANAIAHSSYSLEGTLLKMDDTKVEKAYRRKGLSELMLAEILVRYPFIEKIKIGDIQGKNFKVFNEAYKTMSCEDAIRQTYAYKRYVRFGFTKIVEAKCQFSKFVDIWTDKGPFKMCVQEQELSFTVKRPKKK